MGCRTVPKLTQILAHLRIQLTGQQLTASSGLSMPKPDCGAQTRKVRVFGGEDARAACFVWAERAPCALEVGTDSGTPQPRGDLLLTACRSCPGLLA